MAFLHRFSLPGIQEHLTSLLTSTSNSLTLVIKSKILIHSSFQLDYQGVTVQNVAVNVQGGRPNVLQTYWQQSDVDLSRGMDFTPRGSVFARFTHLQHAPFTYNITVNNQGPARRGTCRIWIAPKNDERGLPWLFRDQRHMMVELDRFTVNCKSSTRSAGISCTSIPILFHPFFEAVLQT